MLEQGLRQGGPLSPYLFICVVEAFIGLLNQVEREGHIQGIKIASTAPSITNLCFADNTMLFGKATLENPNAHKWILELYARVSGQVINFDKSSISFSRNMTPGRRDQIAHILGVHVVENHGEYLGMPLVIGHTKQHIFSSICDRIWKKINAWRERTPSLVGKEV